VEDDRLRKLGTALLAVPVLAIVYAALGIRSAGRFRAAGFVGVAALIAVVLMVGGRAAPSAAAPQSLARTVSAELLDTILTGHGLTAPITLSFDAPMDAASVAAALRIQPEAAISFSWDGGARTLTIAPVTAWSADTLYAITVGAEAHAADGSPLTSAVHAVMLTAKGGTGSLGATKAVGSRVALDTAIAIQLDRAVTANALQAAVHVDPSAAGTVTAGQGPGQFLFTPSAPLAPDTVYHVTVTGLSDGAGIPFKSVPELVVRTVVAPSVVRFRPVDGATAQVTASVLSVRFTDRMDRATTAAAFKVTAAGKAVAGKVAWAESDRVLVFTPSAKLAFGSKVTMTVGAGASSRGGVPIAASASGSFTVQPKPATRLAAATPAAKPTTKPATKPTTKPTAKPTTKPIPKPSGSGGSGGAAASWYSVEVYYLSLMNCTRTGGWVTSSGSCSSPGGRDVAPLTLSAGISSQVSRPYAEYLAVNNLCNHFYRGTPGDRLRSAGYASYNWGENIGCENMSPYAAVLGDHQFFQSEKSYNGGHYRNLMNALYTEVGIGVWVDHGRVRLVIDFYRP
jgi:uncharacterized protein YkwD